MPSRSPNASAVNRISADLERRSAAAAKAALGTSASGRESADLSPIVGTRPEPATPPGSPVGRPFPAATLPPPPSSAVWTDGACRGATKRAVGDGSGRRNKSRTEATGGGHGKTRKTKNIKNGESY